MTPKIAEKATYKTLFKMTAFPIAMMVFTSIYSIVDGIFVANFSGATGFAAINLIFPFVFIVGSLGFMVGTGGTALCSKLLGEKQREKANAVFTMLLLFTLIFGSIVAIISFFCVEPIVRGLSSFSQDSRPETIEQAIIYGRIMVLGQPICMIQYLFHPYLMAAGKTRIAFRTTVAGGVTNMVLDALLIGVFGLGVIGAAAATLCGYLASIIAPLILFARKKEWDLHFSKPCLDWNALGKTLYNGLSAFVGNISGSIVAIFFNVQLLKVYGEDGVSAYGIIMYVSFIFSAIFIGYRLGVSPMISYQYGAKNNGELQQLFIKSLIIISVTGLVMLGLSLTLARPFAHAFSSGVERLEEISTQGLRIYSISFFFAGIAIFGSAFFTALNNGLISGFISFVRTLVFQITFVMTLPLLMGAVGIWWSIVFSEILASAVSTLFFIIKRKKYGYFSK